MRMDSDREGCVHTSRCSSVPDFTPPRPRGRGAITAHLGLVRTDGAVDPATLAQANRAALRAQIADRIVHYIGLLDLLDGDPDFEPDPPEAEPDLEATAAGWTGRGPQRFNVGVAA